MKRMGMKEKAVCYLVMGCLLIQMLGIGKSVHAAEEVWEVNLLKNASMEEIEGGFPASWDALNGWNNPEVAYTTETSHTGNTSVVVETYKTTNPWTSQMVNVNADTLYEASTWLKSSGIAGRGAAIKVEFFKAPEKTNENYLSGVESSFVQDVTGNWQYLSFQLKAPANAKVAYVYLRLYGTGKVYFDDASFKALKPKPMTELATDQIFYYPDQTEGNVKASLYPEGGTYGDKLADMRISNVSTGAVISETSNIRAEEQLQIKFDPRKMVLQQPYKVELTLKTSQQVVLERKEATIYRWERPAALTENGTILVDGKPFLPVIGFHVYPYEYSRVKQAGVNTVIGISTYDQSALKEALDMAYTNGLKVIVPLYQRMKVKENRESTRSIVAALKNHPAVLAWMVMDEPTGNQKSMEELVTAYTVIRSIDNVHPVYVYVYESSTDYLGNMAKVTDILGTGVYPLPKQPITEVGNVARLALSAVNGMKPVWTNVQTYSLPFSIDSTYLPNIEEVRFMTYQALLAGSKGIAYYSFHDDSWWLEASELWQGLIKFRDELQLLSELISTTKAAEDAGNQVRWALWKKGGDAYAVVINEAQEERQLSIPVPFARFHAERIYGGSALPYDGKEGQLRIKLGSQQAALYRISPVELSTSTIDKLLKQGNQLSNESYWQLHLQQVCNYIKTAVRELSSAAPDRKKVNKELSKASLELDQLTNG
ncbi:hypothetical protein [Paenibacillus eucommiae]|uniref:Uncharacterized protein n=1 Tax=Paenibacillus eucommiae TaxID=1355755 RepID=A0ABS4J439_9BACL|nr:hypothetical protein [Paenibacillus eucommiae]MBP1994575.1 hypothetical protein [Paenibacillus eucommiae]